MHPNVAAAVAAHGLQVKVHRHADLPRPVRTPMDFATQIGYPLNRITKTLLVRSGDEFALVVAPMGTKIDFGAVAGHLGRKRVEVAPQSELERLTGYAPQGVSPLGVSGLPLFIDNALFEHDTVLIGAGQPGVELELSPSALADATGATRLPLAR
jgi:Cys-tRNA(Pro)/Cys-tRNA(Cys) deacylase